MPHPSLIGQTPEFDQLLFPRFPVVPKAWPPQTKRRWRLGRRSRCPKFFARYRSQNFDRCHSFLLASSAAGGARNRPRFAKRSPGTRGDPLRLLPVIAKRPARPTRESVTPVPFLMVFAPISTRSSRPLARTLRCAPADQGGCWSLPQPPVGAGGGHAPGTACRPLVHRKKDGFP